MVNFLDTIISVLPSSQKVAIKSLIAAKVAVGELGSIRSRQDESNLIYNRVKTKLNGVLLDPRYAVAGEKMKSEEHNMNMEEVFVDMNSLYASINNLFLNTKDQNVTLDNDYQKSRATIEKLINDVRIYSLRKQNPQFNEIKLIDFNSSTNNNKKAPSAVVSPDVRLLQLKPLVTTRTHLTNRSARTTKIYTKTYSQGLKGELSANFPPENMVDQKPDSFWGTIILADAPVSQIYQKATTTGDRFQVAVEGPVVEVYFKFSHTEKINTIKILPFSEFPVTILDVAYRPSSSSQIFIPIKDFTKSTTLDWEEINFSPLLANEVRVTISQENYKKVSYLLPKSTVVNTDIFQRILKLRASKVIGNSIFDSDFSLYLLSTINSYDAAIDSLQKLYSDFDVDLTTQPNLEFYDDITALIQMAYDELAPSQAADVATRALATQTNQQPGDTTVNITKYEYLLGLREVEINHQFYYPTSYYESEKFVPQATVSELQIEVDEKHTEMETPWQSDYRKTSTEWEVDIGDGRKIPIHPKNVTDSIDDIPAVKDEAISFDLKTNVAYTRLGGYYGTPYMLKKNGDVIPADNYSSLRITGAIPKIEITLTGEYFDTNSIYTVDYAVDPSSYSLDILNRFDSEAVSSPEIFSEVGTDNEIELSKFPFINYEVINLTGFFQKTEEADYNFITPQVDIFSGQLSISPSIIDSVGNVVQQGSTTGTLVTGEWGVQSGVTPPSLSGNPDLSLSYFGDIRGVEFGYFLKLMDSNVYAEVQLFESTQEFVLTEPIVVTEEQIQRWDSLATGQVFSGQLTSPVTGVVLGDYVIGVGVKSDDNIYSITDITYNPLQVTVAGKDAKNITNYSTLIHPAFSIGSNNDNDIEYIQAGKKVYFNQDISGREIRVYYNWLTEYIKILGTLKFNGPVNPNLTPKVNQIRIYSNNLVI
tara:strand:+ start:124578 stop:127370 length:2793 start_codon:yes stop_codon:yes gene_type:complete